MTKEWSDIVDHVSALKASTRKEGRVLWFRGQQDSRWPLRSRAHRAYLEVEAAHGGPLVPDEPGREGLLREHEKLLFHKYSMYARPILDDQERKPWPILFSMQHHGAPTRLLDWTESFACAAFFALEKRDKPIAGAVPSVWVIDPEAWNKSRLGDFGLVQVPDDFVDGVVPLSHYHPGCKRPPAITRVVESLAVVAPLTNSRLRAQQGRFILMGDSFAPMDSQDTRPSVLSKIEITEKAQADAEAFLSLSGYRYATVFPDVHGIVRDIDDEQRFVLGVAKGMV
jgi:FRG domain-containing protein